jgi:hypothetical protein
MHLTRGNAFLKSLGLLLIVAAWVAAGAMADTSGKTFDTSNYQKTRALNELKQISPGVKAYMSGPQVTRLYGEAFAYGSTPDATAGEFVRNHSGIFGVTPDELIPGNRSGEKRTMQPVMFDNNTGEFKFNLYYYSHEIDGIPVFGSELRLLVRNETNYPLVLASSSIHELGNFKPEPGLVGVQSGVAIDAVRARYSSLTDFTEQETVIWAGIEDKQDEPRMAVKFQGFSDFPERYQFVVDGVTGEILYEENLIIFEDVQAQVNGLITERPGSEQCQDEVSKALPFLRVNIGSTNAYTNQYGVATIPNAGSSDVIVQAQLRGQWFRVYNYTGTDMVLTDTVTPPGPAAFLFNSDNNTETERAQANAYYETNAIRSTVVHFNPSYPGMSATEFPVYVNRTDGYCPGNAWYDPGDLSVNFCKAGSSYPNTAWSSVIHHEYGHHLVNMAGSGQGQYGEGIGDCMSVLLSDDPRLGLGFYGSCSQSLRTAVNTFQYPCESDIHTCAQLLSGCVWDTRNALVASNIRDYLDVLKNLTINSILLHTGTMITPQITIDFLTLDDNDGNISNGTPHYYEIAAGFGAHNMDAPELDLLDFAFPNGLPDILYPNRPDTIQVVVTGIAGEVHASGSGMLYYSVNGGGYTSIPMVATGTNQYDAIIPGQECYATVNFYFSAETQSAQVDYDPDVGSSYKAVVATDVMVAFYDDFETSLGWTVSGGLWARGAPTGQGGAYGGPDPASAYGGTNIMGYNLNGDYTNYMPERHVTTPVIDCSGMVGTTLKFQRWLGVEQSQYDHAYVRISTNGSSWTTLWQNSATLYDGAWIPIEIDISSYADGQSTVYLRWTMGTTDGAWTYCGWNIDNVEVSAYTCSATPQLEVATESLPNWTQGISYSQQLTANNGVGTLTWSDKNGNLAGTGLTLSTSGLLAGTPTAAGPISFIAQVEDESKATAEKPFSFTINASVQITTSTLADWTAGHQLSVQLQSTGGTGTIAWNDKNDDLDGTGLALSTTGLLSGTPTADGPISFTAEAIDPLGSGDEAELGFTVNPAIVITTTGFPNWTAGLAFSAQLVSTGGTGNIVWSDKNSNLTGTGLTLSATGLLSGTPITTGTINFVAKATDQIGANTEKGLSIFINPPINISTVDLPDWTVDIAYSQAVLATGGTGELTFADKNGDLATTGLVLNTDGTVTGTPIQVGPISFIVEVGDEIGALSQKTLNFDINAMPEVTTINLPDWTAGVAYSQAITATGGTGQLAFSDKNGDLAATGLTLNTAGTVSGTPTQAGSISFTAMVADEVGATGEKAFGFDINPAVAITTEALPSGKQDESYSQQLMATGGTGDIVWNDLYDELNGTGLTLNSDGSLSGTPDIYGTFEFTAEAADQVGSIDTKALTIVINPAFICGDADDDGSVNLVDILLVIAYVYNAGDPPVYLNAADVDASGTIDLIDILALIGVVYNDTGELVCP